MKFTVIVVLGLVATVLAIPSAAPPRARRQAANSTECNGTTATGLGGVLTQVGYLVGNLLDNVAKIRLTGDGSVLTLLSNLLMQLQQVLNDLLGQNLTDDQARQKQGLLAQLLLDITNLLTNNLGIESAATWTCTRPTGIVGSLLATVVGSLGNLTGSWSSDGGLLTGLLELVIKLVTSLLALLL